MAGLYSQAVHPYLLSTVGGILIGVSAAMVLFGLGRIAGISGILGGAFDRPAGDLDWRLLFLAGLLAGGTLLAVFYPAALPTAVPVPVGWLIASGLLVGFGTRLGNGCTSGHGVCGVGKLSVRSLAATATFIVAGMVTVWVLRALGVFA